MFSFTTSKVDLKHLESKGALYYITVASYNIICTYVLSYLKTTKHPLVFWACNPCNLPLYGMHGVSRCKVIWRQVYNCLMRVYTLYGI